ncbi:MAG: DUF4349 domain-containing protein [Candidatus Moraniibacteriota bacterium]|nr:MAG: DUF4349 domain-containing protein [Candidatus Moranbacteria bacterium]
MNQEFFVKMTRWVAYAAVGVLLIAIFLVFFGRGGFRGAQYQRGIGSGGGVSKGALSWQGMGDMMRDDVADESVPPNRVTAPMMAVDNLSGTEPSGKMMAENQSVSTVALDVASPSPLDGEKRVVRSGALSIRVEDAEWSADEIDRIATRLGGFTASRSLSSDVPGYPMPMMQDESLGYSVSKRASNSAQTGFVTINVPSEKFSEANAAIRGIASVVLSESSSASDVTAQFADLEARIKNKYAEEEAFTKILNTTSGKVSDVLEVTRELSRVRGEIEQLETQKKYMASQTDMASITISLSEDAQVGTTTNTWRPWQTVKAATNALISQFRNFIDGAIYFVVSVVPVFLLYLLGVYVLYRIGKSVYQKMRTSN